MHVKTCKYGHKHFILFVLFELIEFLPLKVTTGKKCLRSGKNVSMPVPASVPATGHPLDHAVPGDSRMQVTASSSECGRVMATEKKGLG